MANNETDAEREAREAQEAEAAEVAAREAATQYFRTEFSGLEIQVGGPDLGQVAPATVRFVPYFELRLGVEGRNKVGFLATDNDVAIAKLLSDPNVKEITKKEYFEATTEKTDSDGNLIRGQRAPY